MSAPALDLQAREVPFFPGGPEALLRVGDVGGRAGGATGTMRTGPWNAGPDGAGAAGALGILIDDVWGGAAVACAPAGEWGMSTELEASFGAPLPTDGSLLHAHGETVHHDDHGALAGGTVRTADGTLLVAGHQRTRFASMQPRRRPLPGDASGAPAERGVADLLGLTTGSGDSLSFTATPALANPSGVVHGGVLFCASELAAAAALDTPQSGLVCTSLQIVYLRPGAIDDELRCVTEVLHRGRTSAAAQVRCLRPDGKPCTVAMLSYGPAPAP